MKTIITTCLGPTDTKGSRIKATDGDGNSITLPWRHNLSDDKNHQAACIALCEKTGWNGRLQGGTIVKNGRNIAHAWVFIDEREQLSVDPFTVHSAG